MNRIQYLTASDLYNINVEITDGNTLVRDIDSLNYVARRPMIALFGEPQFPTITDKAAALLHSLAHHHVFIDGNKRTAVQAVIRFLKLNGYCVTWNFDNEYPFVLEIAQGKHDVEQVAAWITSFIQPLSESNC